ncbi:MAG: Nif3-like dinuclear metal center hexameric protein, partial [Actinomycetes bacterium]
MPVPPGRPDQPSESAAAPAAATLETVVAELDRLYPRSWAHGWDAVGLVCGDPSDVVRRVLLAVDPVADVVDEAIDRRADLLVVHHPLLLRPVSSVAADGFKGRVLHRLIRKGCGLYVAHTNADVAVPGVSDALARVLGLQHLRPLAPDPGDLRDKLVVVVTVDAADAVLDAMASAGAGVIGEYERCAWTTTGTGTFVPSDRARPYLGEPGRREEVA